MPLTQGQVQELVLKARKEVGQGVLNSSQQLFQQFLQDECGLNSQVSAAASKAVVRDKATGMAVLSAVCGDQKAAQRLLHAIPQNLLSEFEDQAVAALQDEFQAYLQTQWGVDKRTAVTISKDLVTEQSAAAVRDALNGDQAKMEQVLSKLSTDLAVQMYQPKFKRFLLQTFQGKLNEKQADQLSKQSVNAQTVTDVRKVLLNNDQAAKQKLVNALTPQILLLGACLLFG